MRLRWWSAIRHPVDGKLFLNVQQNLRICSSLGRHGDGNSIPSTDLTLARHSKRANPSMTISELTRLAPGRHSEDAVLCGGMMTMVPSCTSAPDPGADNTTEGLVREVVLFAGALAFGFSSAAAQSAEQLAQFDSHQSAGKLSIYYMTAAEINEICSPGAAPAGDGFARSCAFGRPDGCDVYIHYGETDDELLKQTARCNRWLTPENGIR